MRLYVDSIASRGVMRSPLASVERRRTELESKSQLLISRMNAIKTQKKSSLLALASGLNAMSPLNVLDRGYVFASDNEGRAVQSVNEVSVGQRLSLRFGDGIANAEIENIQHFDGDN